MSDSIRIGFNIHPRWIDGSDLHSFLAPMRDEGLSALEFELDANLDRWDEFQPIMETAVREGLDLSFHAPYKSPHKILGFNGAGREKIEQDFRPMLHIADQWGERLGSLRSVVFHAALSPVPYDQSNLKDDTVAFLTWVCEEFSHIRGALENNHPPKGEEVKVGVAYEDVLEMVDRIGNDRVGVCWDLGHDYINGGRKTPPGRWLKRVVHVHIHDVDHLGLDHYPLVLGNVPARRWLRSLRRSGMKGLVILELKGERLSGSPPEQIMHALTESIAKIKREVK